MAHNAQNQQEQIQEIFQKLDKLFREYDELETNILFNKGFNTNKNGFLFIFRSKSQFFHSPESICSQSFKSGNQKSALKDYSKEITKQFVKLGELINTLENKNISMPQNSNCTINENPNYLNLLKKIISNIFCNQNFANESYANLLHGITAFMIYHKIDPNKIQILQIRSLKNEYQNILVSLKTLQENIGKMQKDTVLYNDAESKAILEQIKNIKTSSANISKITQQSHCNALFAFCKEIIQDFNNSITKKVIASQIDPATQKMKHWIRKEVKIDINKLMVLQKKIVKELPKLINTPQSDNTYPYHKVILSIEIDELIKLLQEIIQEIKLFANKLANTFTGKNTITFYINNSQEISTENNQNFGDTQTTPKSKNYPFL